MSQLQKIFDHAVPRLLAQDKICYDPESGSCSYRHPDQDLKCIIGMCMTDEAFNKHLSMSDQDYRAANGKIRRVLTDSGFPNGDIDGQDLADLQSIHDSSDPKSWAEHFKKYAKEKGLKYEH